MHEHILVSLGLIILLGISAQWLAWRFNLPSILFLLLLGFLAGPVTGVLDPDSVLGDLLLPVVSVSVAIILFEGGLTLRIRELRQIGRELFLLVSVGVLVTWAIVAAAAYYLLGLDLRVSILLGAVLVVTGPTVIGPLLRHIRPAGRVADLLKWEGIVIDPVGALLAVLVFEVILAGQLGEAGDVIMAGILKTVLYGGLFGFLGAWLLVLLVRKFWVPDFLHETVTLALVVTVFVLSNHFQPESGLFAATLMGLVLYNQKLVMVRHIIEFKENLRIIIISVLFIVLAARLQPSDFALLGGGSLLFLGVVVLVSRPVSVFLSTIGSGLELREKLFLSWMAPRGIVAAAVSSIFALRLSDAGISDAHFLVPYTFLVIVGTVVIYGFTAKPVATRLGVAQANPQGVLFVSAHYWVREIARLLKERGFTVALIDTNRHDVMQARMEALTAYHGSAVSHKIMDNIRLAGIGKLVAMTHNDEANSLSALHFSEIFERESVFQLPPDHVENEEDDITLPRHLRGRYLFSRQADFHYIERRFQEGAVLKATRLTREFDFAKFREYYGENVLPLFLITDDSRLHVFTVDTALRPEVDQTVVALVDDK